MPEIANGMWKFTVKNRHHQGVVYLRDDEIIGASIDDARMADPQLLLLTLHSGPVSINWAEHHEEIVNYIEGKEDAG